MQSGLSAAIGGAQNAIERNNQRATRIAKASQLEEQNAAQDLAKDMAELRSDPAALKANTSVIKTQDEMLGALLDLFA